ncbi:MAG: bifunctional UDP-N-acetylmuramoyl-tripeptide:D-alanyl-D-alanine ligase/alanine racemase [Sphingobacteriia bacterium]|nr:bifunctional UDP-N-acetylmuramoyl-tripeptide:D-alanyl-D-alanine ligase/alanine racemase [Sphingobacteriia bacterium]
MHRWIHAAFNHQYPKAGIVKYQIEHIAAIVNADSSIVKNTAIEYLLTDSRKITFPATSLFFALPGPRRKGSSFIQDAYNRGIKNFVIDEQVETALFSDANFLQVENSLTALQKLAAYHRSQFNIPIVAITGSNGKTIVKEWLNQMLQPDYSIARSPRSYNSQIGVPLSIWQLNTHHTLGIFEAGISTVNEMQQLAAIISPTIGILTNIGDAHNEGFKDQAEKQQEKLKLFEQCKTLIYCKDEIVSAIHAPHDLIGWSRTQQAELFVEKETISGQKTDIELIFHTIKYRFTVPFTDKASINNSITCIALMLHLNYAEQTINERLALLQPVDMRMQLKKGINNCFILNDSYSNDLASLHIALDYLQQQAGKNNTIVIVSDILQSGIAASKLYKQVAEELMQRNINHFIGIGEQVSACKELFKNIAESTFYTHTEQFLQDASAHQFKDAFILLKGARRFEFEKISKWLELKTHQTVLEINLSAIANNLKVYQQMLAPSTKTMAMVKAFSYGSGSAEVARILQFCKIDYLAVAYADEGIDLRRAGIGLPIMVMNADAESFDALVEYSLEPEIYSFNMYHQFNEYLLKQGIQYFPVHLKVNTGMNRLGFEPSEAHAICSLINESRKMKVQSVFSHLVASEAAEHDGFTQQQNLLFLQFCKEAEKVLQYNFIKHISNTAGISRHPYLQYDMVRLGIGLYGVNSSANNQLHLETVATLKTTIAQIRKVLKGNSIGYNRKGVVLRDSLIATIRIGYADGFSRSLGNNTGAVYINNQLAPVIGNVCMDMAMVDVTDIVCEVGDTVELFGKNLPVQQVALWANTIPYEIMTSVSQRVKRVYIEE